MNRTCKGERKSVVGCCVLFVYVCISIATLWRYNVTVILLLACYYVAETLGFSYYRTRDQVLPYKRKRMRPYRGPTLNFDSKTTTSVTRAYHYPSQVSHAMIQSKCEVWSVLYIQYALFERHQYHTAKAMQRSAEVTRSLLVGLAPVEGVIPVAVLPVGILFCERGRVRGSFYHRVNSLSVFTSDYFLESGRNWYNLASV